MIFKKNIIFVLQTFPLIRKSHYVQDEQVFPENWQL